jgi:ubiquitin carboxyl-terminal hydrolase 9/24
MSFLNNRVKANLANTKIDLYLNGEPIDPNMKLVAELPLSEQTILTAKLYQANTNLPSSPDSSSESSSASPQNLYEGPNIEAENLLPGVIISKKPSLASFFFQIADLGMSVGHLSLVQNTLSILNIMPADQETISRIKTLCSSESGLESLFVNDSPTQVAYNLNVIYSLLMPAQNPMSDESLDFQYHFVKSGCGSMVLDLLTKNKFLLKADDLTKV